MVKRYSETRFNSEGFDTPANEIGVFENTHGEYVKFTDYDSREGELLAVLEHARNALMDYIPSLEKRGASLHYGRKVLDQINTALRSTDNPEAKS